MTAINLNSSTDKLHLMTALEAEQFKEELKNKPARRLRTEKALSRMDEKSLLQTYKAWMHCRNGRMPSEKTMHAFEKLSKAKMVDVIVRLKVKVRRQRRAK